MYNFDNGVNRKGTHCVKWDVPFVTEDMIPMWIADMDFEVAPAITENLCKVAKQGTFGYQFLSKNYFDATINWMKRKHGYEVAREEIIHVPNIVLGLSLGIQSVTEPGDEVLVMTPVYGPFFEVIKDNGRVLVESPMKNENGYYTMDLEDFESRITEKTKAVIICNPHNPTGRVWTKAELQELADICVKHGLYILSDDIHSEFHVKEHNHTFIATLSEEVRQKTLTFTSPTKAFNLAGIHVANCFIADETVRAKYQRLSRIAHVAENNSFAEAALVAAYDESEDWLDELNAYIEGNLDYFVDFIQKEIPALTVYKPEATYLVWVDFRKTQIPAKEVQNFLKAECHVLVNDGTFFGAEGEGFVRFNLACPRKQIGVVLQNLKEKLA